MQASTSNAAGTTLCRTVASLAALHTAKASCRPTFTATHQIKQRELGQISRVCRKRLSGLWKVRKSNWSYKLVFATRSTVYGAGAWLCYCAFSIAGQLSVQKLASGQLLELQRQDGTASVTVKEGTIIYGNIQINQKSWVNTYAHLPKRRPNNGG